MKRSRQRRRASISKAKVSITIDTSILKRVDRARRDMSRIEVVEIALKRWLKDRRSHELEAQVAAYYSGRGAEEVEEDREWADR